MEKYKNNIKIYRVLRRTKILEMNMISQTEYKHERCKYFSSFFDDSRIPAKEKQSQGENNVT